MRQFTLLHDGSSQGWHTAYLAFHVATRLGAPVQVLLVESKTSGESRAKRVLQVETGAYAAGVTIKTQFVEGDSVEALAGVITTSDGIFTPNRLMHNEKTALHFLEAFTCPLWIVKGESVTRKMAVLADKESKDGELLNYAVMLSNRLEGTLKGLFIKGNPIPALKNNVNMEWYMLRSLSQPRIASTLKRLQVDLLFIPVSKFSLVGGLKCTCVVCPSGLLK